MANNRNYKDYRNYNQNNPRPSKRGLYLSIFVIIFVIVGSILASNGIVKFPLFNTNTTNQTTQTTKSNVVPVEINDGEYLKVHFIDVGQGDSILVESVENSKRQFMLIDAGTSEGHTANVVLDYLEKVGAEKLDYFIITHPHTDHAGGADNVIKKVNIDKVFIPDCEYPTVAWNKVLTAIDDKTQISLELVDKNDIGSTYKLGKGEFTILWPENPSVVKQNDINEVSIVVRLVYGEKSFMFTGDAETPNEKAIVANNSKDSLKCDVLKAGHHGSNTSSCEEFVKAVNPSIVIISCGAGNKYGHPHDEPMALYKKLGCTIYRTDELGTIVLVSDGKSITLEK